MKHPSLASIYTNSDIYFLVLFIEASMQSSTGTQNRTHSLESYLDFLIVTLALQRCDCCFGRLANGKITAAISIYKSDSIQQNSVLRRTVVTKVNRMSPFLSGSYGYELPFINFDSAQIILPLLCCIYCFFFFVVCLSFKQIIYCQTQFQLDQQARFHIGNVFKQQQFCPFHLSPALSFYQKLALGLRKEGKYNQAISEQ